MPRFSLKLVQKFSIILLLVLFLAIFSISFYVLEIQKRFYLKIYENFALSSLQIFEATIKSQKDLEETAELQNSILKATWILPQISSLSLNLFKENKLITVASNKSFLLGKEARKENWDVFLSGKSISKKISEKGENFLYSVHPLRLSGQTVGTIEAKIRLESIETLLFQQKLFFIFLVFLSGLFLIVTLSLSLNKLVLSPLYQLLQGIREVEKGNFDFKFEIRKSDEFSEIFSGFNQMAKKLKENYNELRRIQEELEERVRKRTEELEEAKKVLEIRVEARTRQLRELAIELEEKVKQKTKELEQRVKELELMRKALLNILEDVQQESENTEKERKKTLAIIENFADGIFFFDAQNTLVILNPLIEKFFQIEAKNILGKNFEELKKEENLKPLFEVVKDLNVPIFRKEIQLRENLILEISLIPIFSETKKIGSTIICHDVTREKMVERIKTEFVSISAHQLRTPLSAIKWSLKMILDGDLGPLSLEQRQFLEKTYQANQRLINLVNDLLDVTRIEEGRYLFKLELLDFKEILLPLFEFYEKEAEKKKIQLINEIEEKSLPIKADKEKINLAVQNLIDNAVKYTLPGGKVIIGVKEKEGFLLFWVKDTGVGIPESQKERVFSKFFRGSNVQKMDTEGTGLGLFITKNIIEAHGGRIWFESKENEGTTFYFTLPLFSTFQ